MTHVRFFALECCEPRRLLAGTVTGFVRLDNNDDSIAETPLGNVSVFIDENHNDQLDEGERKVFTDGSSHLGDGITPNPNYGRYTLDGLAPGTYRIRVQPAHYHRIYEPAANNGTYIVAVTGNEIFTDLDFGVHNVGAIGGIIYHDANEDGVFTYNNPVLGDDGKYRPGPGDDPLITGVTAYLDLDGDGVYDPGEPTNISRDYVSFFGQNYNFRDLDPDTYTVRILEAPDGFTGPTPASQTSTVAAGQETNDDNFGFTQLAPPPPAGSKVDFNGDGKTDILFRNNAGSIYWALNGPQRLLALPLQAPPAGWSLGAAADFNGDGLTDVVYHHDASGASQIWIHNGIKTTQQVNLPVLADTAWRIVGAGDFNQDGKNDLVWRNTITGQNTLWLMNGTTLGSFRAIPSTANQAWAVAGVGDFNDDGIDDIVWRNTSDGRNTLWLMNSTQRIAAFKALDVSADQGWQIYGVDDYDNDGDPDLFWRHATRQQNMLWTYNGTQRTAFINVLT